MTRYLRPADVLPVQKTYSPPLPDAHNVASTQLPTPDKLAPRPPHAVAPPATARQQPLGVDFTWGTIEPTAEERAQALACEVTSNTEPDGGAKLLHFVQYNILNGAHDLTRRHRLCTWLRVQAADVVTMIELNFWNATELQSFGRQCGYPHTRLLVGNSPYRVGALSRTPIKLVAEHRNGFAHGALHFEARGWHFVVTHLTPEGAKSALQEAKQLTERLRQTLDPPDVPLVIMGDLNSLSPLDISTYTKHSLASTLDKTKIQTSKSKDMLAAKFLTEGGKAVNYAVMEHFYSQGFVDVRPLRGAEPSWPLPEVSAVAEAQEGGWVFNSVPVLPPPLQHFSHRCLGGGGWGGDDSLERRTVIGCSQITGSAAQVPTGMHNDAMHAAPMRLDYCLMNPAAAALIGGGGPGR